MPVTREYDVPLMVARGYSSETFAYNAAEAMRETGKPCFVYYVGDFDPSGWQMARSLEQKLDEFGAPVVFERLAVNLEQIQTWALPTRPSKVSDTRCKAFFAEFGAYLERRLRQNGTTTKIPSGRGLSHKTFALRAAIMAAFEETDKPVTVRQMFYMLTVRGRCLKGGIRVSVGVEVWRDSSLRPGLRGLRAPEPGGDRVHDIPRFVIRQ